MERLGKANLGDDLKVGDLVKIKEDEGWDDSGRIGVIYRVSDSYPPTCDIVFSKNFSSEIFAYNQEFVEVISDS